jgi:Uma2 family endonuclease
MPGSDRVRPSNPGLPPHGAGVRRGDPGKLTYDDFVHFPDDGKRHELIDGEHYATPSPRLRHQVILGNLFVMIASWLEDHPIGRVFLSPLDVVMSDFDVVEPDLLYLSNARAAETLTELHVRGVPELVVEIASPGTRRRDDGIKRRLYERAGVTEYWIVDPDVDRIRVHLRDGDAFGRAIELSREHGDLLSTPMLPGLEMPLPRIFRD